MEDRSIAVLSPILPQSGPPTGSATNDNTSGNFAFLVHSQQTLTNGLPPNVDNMPFVRPRRKRTSPEDHAILEAEYQRNPKPDKSERLSIVRRVALGEKEVQIWFQNRRQQTRRKTQPLLPHEVFATLHTKTDCIQSTSLPSTEINISNQQKLSSSKNSNDGAEEVQCNGKETGLNTLPTILKTPGERSSINSSSQGSAYMLDLGSRSSPCRDVPIVAQENPSCAFGPRTLVQPTDIQSMNERGVCSSNCPETKPIDIASDNPSSVRPLKRTSSSIRLSLSLDGKAQVIVENGSSPSPPRPKQSTSANLGSRHEPFRRSRSAGGPENLPFQSFESKPLQLPRCKPVGRSRDARTWEFYCDSDARNALTIQAEEEQKGSAERAIGLIRSSSSRVLRPATGSQNAQLMMGTESMKRKKNSRQTSQKPKLARTASSFARLQTVEHKSIDQPRQKAKALKPDAEPDIFVDFKSDSDKENWEPGTQHRNIIQQRIRSAFAQTQHGILGERDKNSRNPPSHDAVLNRTNPTSRGRSVETKKCSKMETAGTVDGEIGALVSESGGEEELDCVQNLLSLSQGAWR